MESQFSASRKVLQLAIARLKDEGFVRSLAGRGLYVSDHPPHLKRYSLVFPVTVSSPEWSRFDEVLLRQADEVEKQSVIREFRVFAGVGEHGGGTAMLERLRSECRGDRLAGLILMPGTHELALHPPFSRDIVPKVFVFRSEEDPYRPIVSVNGSALVARGLDWLVKRGRRRVALIRLSDYGATWDWRGFYAEAGLEFRPQWIQPVARFDPSVVQALIPLLMDYPADQRPDGLFVIDENLTDYAATAMVAQGVRLGEDMDIVAHCNWPTSEPKILPMRRIGFHAGHLLDRCLQAIDAQRRGETPPAIQLLNPLFEDETQPIRQASYQSV